MTRPPTTNPRAAAERSPRAALAGTLALDVGLPLALFYGLRLAGVNQWLALVASALAPVARLAVQAVTQRHVSRPALFSLSLIGAGTAIGLLTADPRLMLARESYLTAVVGAWILATHLARRPLIFEATARLMPEPAARAWQQDWDDSPTFRRTMRAMNAAFGSAFMIDAAARIVMAYTLPVDTVPILSVLLLVVMLAAVVQIGKAYGRRHSRLARAGAASNAEAGKPPPPMRSAPQGVKDG